MPNRTSAPRSRSSAAVSGHDWNWKDCFEPSARRNGVRPRKSRASMSAPARHQQLDDLVQAAEGRAVQRGEVGLVHGVDVGARRQQHLHGLFAARRPQAPRLARRVGGGTETGRGHQRRRAVDGRQRHVGAGPASSVVMISALLLERLSTAYSPKTCPKLPLAPNAATHSGVAPRRSPVPQA